MQSFLQHLRAMSQSSPHQPLGSDLTCRAQIARSQQRARNRGRLVHLIAAGAFLLPQVLMPSLPVQADRTGICAVPGKDGSPIVNGMVNSYYPGTGIDVSIGSTSIPVGSINPNGNLTPIAAGDLLLIIQMQDADINSTDTDAYGDGVSGGGNTGSPLTSPNPLGASGLTNLNNAGRYEYAVATGPISGGAIPISQGTTYSYRTSTANTTNGNRSYQVVRVPQYTSATISGTLTTAAQWNGSSGGIVAVDVKGALTFNPGSIVDVNGLGFRGGGSNPNGYAGSASQRQVYRSVSKGSLVENNNDAPKGEGIAGTPRIISTVPFGSFNVRSATSTTDLGVSGYPNGDEGRGAPGNAGGGGNDHNSGGGGGANGGNGGLGGRAFNGAADGYVGGFGGTALSPTPTRLFLGGGGGAGDTNDQSRPSGAGGGGGGLAIVRAGTISGSGTINALGADGIDSPLGKNPDAGGGGGAGGTVLITATSGSLSGLTVNVNGGVGGDLNTNGTSETDGIGGGGGGGAVYVTSAATFNANGGNSGMMINNTTTRNNTPNGATNGTAGFSQVISASDLPTGISGNSPLCSPSISGKVFNDADGSKLQNVPEAGTNGGGLNAVLIDGNNLVVATTVVAADGTYSFSNTSANTTYTIQITTATATVGSAPPAISLPTNWVSTGENFQDTVDTTIDSKLLNVVVGISNITGANFGIKQNPAAVLLLKRITAINGLSTNPNDNTTSLTGVLVDPNWKAGYVVGATNGGPVKPGDTIEYTIYYLNNGGRNAKSVRICDRLNAKQSFQPNTYTTGAGMQVQIGGDRITNTAVNLTNQSGDDGGQFIAATSPVTALPTNCKSVTGAPNNDYGALILDLVTNPGSPNLTTLPGRTGQGTPNNSFGFWRFTTKVNISP